MAHNSLAGSSALALDLGSALPHTRHVRYLHSYTIAAVFTIVPDVSPGL